MSETKLRLLTREVADWLHRERDDAHGGGEEQWEAWDYFWREFVETRMSNRKRLWHGNSSWHVPYYS